MSTWFAASIKCVPACFITILRSRRIKEIEFTDPRDCINQMMYAVEENSAPCLEFISLQAI